MNVFFSMLLKFFLVYSTLVFRLIKSDEYEYKLIKDLLKTYNIYARPSVDHNEPTNVTFELSLSQLIDVDEKNQIITTNCWLTMHWIDHNLVWNETEYGGIKEIRLPHDKIWKPDIILYNNADALATLAHISTQMIILSNGNVTWLSTVIFRSSCSIDVHDFPFDKQNCSLSFASWTYDGSGINLLKNGDKGDISNYLVNGEWDLENLLVERNVIIYSCCPKPYINVTYYIVIKRRPLFYVFNMILPSVLITIVGFLGFVIPPDSGEKVSMGVTTLLSMTVFLQVVADSMPPNSDNVPLIAAYYFGSMLIISLATAGTVLTLNIYKKGDDEEPVPWLWQRIFFDIVAKLLFIKIKANRSLTKSVKEIISTTKKNYFNMTNTDKINLISERLNKLNEESVIHISATNPVDVLSANNNPQSKLILRASPFINENNQRRKKIQLHCETVNLSTKTLENLENNTSNANKNLDTNQNEEKFFAIASSSDISNNNNNNNNINNSNTKQTNNYGGARSPGSFSPINLSTNEFSMQESALNDYERKQFGMVLKSLNRNLDKTELREALHFYKLELKEQWTNLAKVVDTLFLYLFIVSTLCMLIIIVSQAPEARFY